MREFEQRLHDACMAENWEEVDRLIEEDEARAVLSPCDLLDNPLTRNDVLCWASKCGDLEVVKLLLGIDGVDATGMAFLCAAAKGCIAVVNYFLEIKAVDPSCCGNDAVQTAALNGHCQVVDRLLEDERVDPTGSNNYALRAAAGLKHVDVVARLLREPAVIKKGVPEELLRGFAQQVGLLLEKAKVKDPEILMAVKLEYAHGHVDSKPADDSPLPVAPAAAITPAAAQARRKEGIELGQEGNRKRLGNGYPKP